MPKNLPEPVDFKSFLQRYQESFISDNLPVADRNFKKFLESTGAKSAKYRFEATRDVLRASGVLPAEHQSIFVQNIYNQNNIVLSEQVREILRLHNKALDDFVEGEEVGE